MLKPLSYLADLQENILPYNGPTGSGSLSGYKKKASIAYDNQKRRCYCKTNPRYKDNGEKGIKVLYSKKDFIAWYLHYIKEYKGKNPSVGRIDHSKSYSFDNIRIESIQDNSNERIQRCGPTRSRKKVYIIIAHTKEKIMIADSIRQAAKLTGAQQGHIPKYCRKELNKTKNGYTFEYVK